MPKAFWTISPPESKHGTRMTLPRYEAYILEQRNAAHRERGLLPLGRHILLTFRVLLRGWWLFLAVSGLIVLGSQSILKILERILTSATGTGLVNILRLVPSGGIIPDLEYTIPSFADNPQAVWLVVGLLISLVVVQLWGVAALIGIVSALPTGRIGGAVEGVTGRLVSYIILSVINLLTIIGGLFLLILPGIVIAIWFLFSPFVHLIEGESVAFSFQKSRQLVQGYGFLVLIRVVIAALLIIATTSLIAPWDVGQRLLPILLLPLNVIFFFLLYTNLRLIKRDLTLEAELEEPARQPLDPLA